MCNICKGMPTATTFIRFRQPITGAQVAELVRQVSERSGRDFIVDTHYDDRLMSLGQSSDSPYEHIRVEPLPSLGLPFFTSETYSEVKVTSCAWEGVKTNGYTSTQDDVDWAVFTFTRRLRAAYEEARRAGSFPEYVEPE